MPITQLLLQDANVTTDYVLLKFGPSVRYDSIEQGDFDVTKADLTVVSDPFEEILLVDHYDPISREITLYWQDGVLEASTDYVLTVSGIKSTSGEAIAAQSVTFTTGDDVTQAPGFPSDPPDVEIEDHSIHLGVFDIVDGGTGASDADDTFYVDATDPENYDYYLPESYNDGRVDITFTLEPHADSFTDVLFKVQRRQITRNPSRWETVSAEISKDAEIVHIDFPTPDATPSYYTEDGVYFEENYKYRIIVSQNVFTEDATPITLGEDFQLLFAGILNPLYVNPDELSVIFDDATQLEIAEWIHIYSVEIKDMFNLQDDEAPTFAMQEYIKAAAACSLSKIYDIDGDEASITLGDLTVTNRTYAKANVNTGNASTWCELAAALRKELLFNTTGPKWARKASVYVNPIPDRKLKRLDQELVISDESLN